MESRKGEGKRASHVKFQDNQWGQPQFTPAGRSVWKFHSEFTHLSHPGFCNQGSEFGVVLSIRPEVSGDMVHLLSPVS